MNDNYKILLLEDVLPDAELVVRELKKNDISFNHLTVNNESDYITALDHFVPDIVLFDHTLPSLNSSEAIKILKDKQLSIPFILITATLSMDVAMSLAAAGVDDYVLKDHLQMLPYAIVNAVEKFRLKKEQQRLTDELVKNEKRFRALVENAAEAVVILNAKGKVSYASPAVEKVLGYTEEDVMQMDLFTVAHPDDIVPLAAIMEQVLANPGVAIKGHTGRMLHKDGSWRWLEATVTNLLHDPAVNGIVDNFRDITESKVAEEEIIKKEHTFRALIENSVEGMAILSVEGKPLYVSTSIKNVLGYTQEEAMHLDLLKLSHPEDASSLNTMMVQAMANPGVAVKGDATRMRDKNGSWHWIEGTITNMLHDPAIGGIVDNFRDVTERKLAEKKIIHLNRLYAFLSQINQTIVHSYDEQIIFKEACRIAIEIGEFKAAWIGMIDVANAKLDLIEGFGILPEDLAYFTNVAYDKNGVHAGVLQSGTYYLCNNVQQNYIAEKWKPLAAKRGYASCIVLPLKKFGTVIGAFNLFATEVGFFTPDEIALLEEATSDISFGLDIVEKQKQKLLADDLVKHKELRLNRAQAIAHVGSWELDFSTSIAIWSDELLRIYGLEAGDNKQSYSTWLQFIHPADIDYVLQKTNETKTSFNSTAFFHRIIRRDGAVRHLQSQTRFEFNNDGKPKGLYGAALDVTEIKEAEEALRKSESNLKAIFENTSDGFILTDLNGIIKSFNNRSKDTINLNIGAEINVGDSIFDFVHPSRKDNYKNIIAKVLSGEMLQYDYPYERKNGETHWFNFSINPVYAGNEITGLSITSTDITERKLTANLLLRSEANLKAVIENTDAFIYSLDKDLRYVTFNQGLQNLMKELYGIDIKPGYNIFDFINQFEPAAAEEWNSTYSKCLKGEIVKFEKEFKHNDFYSCTSFSIHPIWENNNVIGLSCFVHDITKEKKAEEENRFKANLLNTIAQAAIATDLNGLVSYWNKAAEQIYGWTKEEAIGKNIIDLTPSHPTKEQAFQIMEALKQGHTWSGEFRVRRKDGSEFPAFVTDSPVYDQQNKLSGIIGISSDITEKKKLEDLLDKASSMARIGSYEANLTTNTLYWSAITKEIHEVEDDFIPKTETAIAFYKEGSSREALTKAYFNSIEKNLPFDLELQIVTAKGHERWVRVIGEAECDNGVCTRMYGSFQDIDKIKKAELEVLRVYEEKNTILESIGDAFFAVDKNWIVTYWNNQAEKILHSPKNKIIGQNLWDVFSDSTDSLSCRKYYQAIKTNEIVHFEDFYMTLGKWFEISAYPSSNGLTVYFKDITEQKQAEAALKKSEFRYRQIVETAQEGIWVIDENSKTTFVNKKLCEILEYSNDEMRGKEIYFFMNDEGKQIAGQLMEKKKTGATGQGDFMYISKSGKEIWANVSANPIFDENGSYKGALAMITDITNRKRQEIQIQKNTEERELLIGELTKSLKDLKQFSFITSHNFRAPLSNLVALLTLIDFSTLDQNNKEIVEMFKTSTNQLNKTINDLIQILIIRNNVNINVTDINIRASLNEVLNLLAQEINESNCTINLNLKIENLSFHQSYLDSILINLLSNALKYRSPERVLIINISTGLNSKGEFVLTIEDNGLGINLIRHQNKLFGLYQRFHSNTDGVGLGLFMAKSQITALGGKIEVDSEEGKGTTFYITFKKIIT